MHLQPEENAKQTHLNTTFCLNIYLFICICQVFCVCLVSVESKERNTELKIMSTIIVCIVWG